MSYISIHYYFSNIDSTPIAEVLYIFPGGSLGCFVAKLDIILGSAIRLYGYDAGYNSVVRLAGQTFVTTVMYPKKQG
jgi:hypothetical protein